MTRSQPFHPKTDSRQAGFTIVELMIATMVFSTIVLVITFGIMQFSRAYYRGTTTTSLQNTTRNVMDSVSQAIQFSGSDVVTASTTSDTPGTDPLEKWNTYCIGGTQFDVDLYYMRNGTTPITGQRPHVLYSTTSGSSCAHKVFDPAASHDLVDPNVRAVKFAVQKSSDGANLWSVDIRLAYGRIYLLCSPSVGASDPSSCSSTGDATDIHHSDLTCKVTAGSQFCAVSELTTIVQKRVQ